MSGDARARRTRGRVYLFANALLLVSICAMANYLAFRHYDRWDWTEGSIYTLSGRTESILGELDRPIEILVLLSEAEPEHAELRNLLDRYRAASERIRLRFVDPHRDPGAYQQVARRFRLGLAERETRDGTVVQTSDVAIVVAAGERHWEIGRNDLVSPAADPMDEDSGVQLNVEAERAVTGAIVQVTRGRATKVCFTTGHGELPMDDEEALGELAAELRRENFEHQTVETRGQSQIERGCDAVAVLAPQIPFPASEVRLLRDYLRRGGNLLLALDPILDPDRRGVVPSGFEDALTDLGVRVDSALAVETNSALLPEGPGNPVALYVVSDFGEHAITAPFAAAQLPLLAGTARGVSPIDEGRVHPILRTSDQSYGETDLSDFEEGLGEADPDDLRGPISLGVATRVELSGETPPEADEEAPEEELPPGGRLVVLGDATLFANELFAQPAAINGAFAGAVFGWLTERPALISIPARTVESAGVPSQEDTMNLFFSVVVLIPGAFIFLGIAVWWNRRL